MVGVASVLQFLMQSLRFAGNPCSHGNRRRVIKLEHCTPSYKRTDSFTKRLRRLFHSPIVLGSYINPAMAACALALVLIVATRGRMGYREEVDTVFDETAAVR